MKAKRVLIIMGLFLGALLCMAQEKKPEVRSLTPGQSVAYELKSGEMQTYQVRLVEGEFLHLVVDQRGIGAALTLSSGDGKKLVTGDEFLSYVAAANGSYTLEVKGRGSDKSGRYVLQVEDPRAATARDKKSFEAEQVLAEGTAFSDESTQASQQKAIEKFKAALSIYQEIKDRRGEAKTLNSLGMAHDYLNLYERAREYYERALPIRHELKDGSGEAGLLNSLSFVYYHLKQFDKAREYTEKALAIYREIADKDGEHEALANLDFLSTKPKQGEKAKGPGTEGRVTGGCRELICNMYGCWWHYYYCY